MLYAFVTPCTVPGSHRCVLYVVSTVWFPLVNPYLSLDRPLCQYLCPPEVMGSLLYFSLCCNQSYEFSHSYLGVTPPPPPQCLLNDFYLVLGVGRVTDRDAYVLACLLASTCILNSVTQFLDVSFSIGTPNVSVGIMSSVTD